MFELVSQNRAQCILLISLRYAPPPGPGGGDGSEFSGKLTFSLARTAVLVLALPALAAAQGFPNGPVKLIVPFPPRARPRGSPLHREASLILGKNRS